MFNKKKYLNFLIGAFIVCKSKLEHYLNDDKRLQNFDKIISYPYRTSVGKVCKTDLLSKYK